MAALFSTTYNTYNLSWVYFATLTWTQGHKVFLFHRSNWYWWGGNIDGKNPGRS